MGAHQGGQAVEQRGGGRQRGVGQHARAEPRPQPARHVGQQQHAPQRAPRRAPRDADRVGGLLWGASGDTLGDYERLSKNNHISLSSIGFVCDEIPSKKKNNYRTAGRCENLNINVVRF